jgi:hypothetical protein
MPSSPVSPLTCLSAPWNGVWVGMKATPMPASPENTQSKAKGKRPGGTPPVQKGTGSIAKKKPETKSADDARPRKPKSKGNTTEDDETLIASMISCSILLQRKRISNRCSHNRVQACPKAGRPPLQGICRPRACAPGAKCCKFPQSPFVVHGFIATMPTTTAQTMNSTTLSSLTTRVTSPPTTGREDSRNCRPSVRDGARCTARVTCEFLQTDAVITLADESLPLNTDLNFFKQCCHQNNRSEARLNALYMRRWKI